MENKKTYSEKLRDPRWQKKRLEILNRDNFTCLLCQDSDSTLHVHHLSYHGNPWDAPSDKLQTLCQDCHKVVSQTESINYIPILKFKDKYKTILFTGDVSDTGESFLTMYQLSPEAEIQSSFEFDYNDFEQLKHFFEDHFTVEIPLLND